MFYQPSIIGDSAQRYSAWSNHIAHTGEKFVCVVPVQRFDGTPAPMGLAVAESTDGVHWRETQPFACPLDYALAGFCIRWTGHDFVYYSSERNTGPDRETIPLLMRQYRTPDWRALTPMGEAFTTRPDPRWYRCRWDELVVLEDGGLFYGYITSEPRPEFAVDSLGMLRSDDGLAWQVLPPPVFEWEGLPPQQMEVCFCEQAGGRYYLGMGSRCYLGHLGFSVVVFVADQPTGPFRPDQKAFRLCGSTTRDTSWLAKTFRRGDEILFSNWHTTTLDRSYPGIFGNGQSLWIGPLKRFQVDGKGHLRLAWWPGNEAVRGAVLPADLRAWQAIHPVEDRRERWYAFTAPQGDAAALSAGRDGAVLLSPEAFDFDRGLVVEGTVGAAEQRGHIGTHWHAAAAGFYFEHAPGRGMLMQLETLGLTRTGLFEYATAPAFDADEFALAAFGNMDRGGPYQGLSRFTEEDRVGPIGYAPPCGLRNGRTHRFRLLVKGGLFELYLDDLLVQTYVTGPASGRLGLVAKSGAVTFDQLRFHAMG